MNTATHLKEIVKEQYTLIAGQDADTNATSCCGSGACTTEVYNIMNEEYSSLEGYNPDADLKLGCGLPTEFAKIKAGDVVVDLGSGAGNDCFVARHQTGETGKVIGIDFTEAMIAKARDNADKLHFHNVEFRLGDIEAIPIAAGRADVVVSNCVMNLVPDKTQAFCEVFRILKPGGHFSISDVVLAGELPAQLKSAAEMYAGCVSGAIQKEEYLDIIKAKGFTNITLQKEKPIVIPTDILSAYLSAEEVAAYTAGENVIWSITVYAEKVAACGDSGCC